MTINNMSIPVVPLRGLTILPNSTIHFDISRESSINAVKNVLETDRAMFVVSQKDPMLEEPTKEDVYTIGTIVKVRQLNKLNSSLLRVMVEAKGPAKVVDFYKGAEFYEALIEPVDNITDEPSPEESEAVLRDLKEMLEKFNALTMAISNKTLERLLSYDDPLKLMTEFLVKASVDYRIKQEFLEANTLFGKYEIVYGFLTRENKINSVKQSIAEKVKKHMDELQREHILREHLQAINEELGDDVMSESEEIEKKIKELNAKDYVKEKLMKELGRYKSFGHGGVEGNVIKTYLDTMLEMPWDNMTEDNPDLNNAEKILNRDHYGLDKIKERIIEFLAVRNLTKEEGNSPIICLVGPPGTGKTSIAKSVAEALNKKYVRISLGGVDDESEIRGHRKTYVGAMPGRIATALKQCKSGNPLILFDEIDKLGRGIHGDPASALLEVMDSEQNVNFRDNYVEVPIDLSNVLFIATANDASTIPEPLYDRMEVIEVSGYTANEKFHIAREHLYEKQLKKHGIKVSQLEITDDAIKDIIEFYTREAGVRQLEREIAKICRKTAAAISKDGKKKVKVTSRTLKKYLGRRKYEDDLANEKDDIGIVRGLAWTAVGGTTLQIEVNTMPGKGELKITGQLGDVMKESAEIALSYVRSIASKYGVDQDFFKEHAIHIHVPEGATPKDGPSAGITMATALLSAVAGIKVDCKVAMTGEINLRGAVMPIGGIKEKLLAAKTAGIKTVCVPIKNKTEVLELDKEITEGMDVVFVKEMSQVLKVALKK